MLAGPKIDAAAWRFVLSFESPDYSGGPHTRLPAHRLVIYCAKPEDCDFKDWRRSNLVSICTGHLIASRDDLGVSLGKLTAD